jgi:molybdenum cofactor cytidylyltransferase
LRIVAILLAAGAGVRFGGGKLSAKLPGGATVGARAAANLRAVLPDVIAVVRPGDDELAKDLAAAGSRVTACSDAHRGMGVSLAHGVREAGESDAFLVALADMPWISGATIGAVVHELERGEQLVVPRFGGRRGHPVGFGGGYRPSLLQLTGDTGAKSIIASAPSIRWLDVDDPGVLGDIDTPDDLVRGNQGW